SSGCSRSWSNRTTRCRAPPRRSAVGSIARPERAQAALHGLPNHSRHDHQEAATPMTQQTVLICGGGIGGLAAALVLARQGYRVEVFEQSDAFKEIGAGIQIGPNA